VSYIADFSDIVLGHSHSDQPAEKTDVRNYDLTDHPKSKVPAEQKGLAEELKGPFSKSRLVVGVERSNLYQGAHPTFQLPVKPWNPKVGFCIV